MGIIRDILDTIRDIGSIGNVNEVFKKRRYSSLSKRSLEGTLQFPVLVSKSMDIDTLQMISKALERQFASFVQVSLSMSPTLNLSSDKDAIGYLRRFHQNINVKSDLKDVFNEARNLMESFEGFSDETKTKFMFAAVCEGATMKIIAANKEQIQGILEHVRQDILNNKFIPRQTTYRFANPNLNYYHNNIVVENDNTTNRVALDINVRSEGGGRGGSRTRTLKDMDVNFVPNNILKDNDVKKSNELVPTTLHIRTALIHDTEGHQGFLDFIIGVKATMHPIASDEMVTNVVNACRNNNKFFNFIRWTSGEISFFKDFLFNIKEIKDDVINRSAGASPWWITLKRRRALAKLKDALWMPNQILPNASIVISMEEVEYIKTEYGFDLLNPAFIDKIMNQYFLLAFVIVDNSAQIAHFMFDGQTSFQSVTFSALERENTNKADLRETLKLINRSNMV